MRRRQLGGNKNIRLGLIPIPTGIFLELTGNAHFAVKVSRFMNKKHEAAILSVNLLSLGVIYLWIEVQK